MADFRFRFAAATGQYAKTVADAQAEIARRATAAIADAGDYVKRNGRANIAAAGFSTRWQNTLRVNLYPSKGSTSLHPVALAYHKIPYAGVFETGATIAGSPLLWLPLPDVPTTVFGKHMSPANYIRQVGPLHTIIRPGKPPLLAGYMAATTVAGSKRITIAKLVAGSRAAARATPGAPAPKIVSVPLFFGIDKVTLQKRFDLLKVFDAAKSQLGVFYLKHSQEQK